MRTLWCALLALLCIATLPTRTTAQVDLLGEVADQAAPVGEIGLVVQNVGLGNAARPGAWTGIRVRVTDRGSDPRDVLLRVSLPDVDGDGAQLSSLITTNPNIGDQPEWVYARMPFDIAQTNGFVVQAFDAVEAPDTELGAEPGRLLGQTRFDWGNRAGPTTGIMAVIGQTPGGVLGYTQGATDGANPLGHEITQISTISDVDNLPDRWLGYAMVREVIWNDGPKPGELRNEQVRALREWIQRGGHLVIVLPAAGQDWFALRNQDLAGVLPRVSVTRLEQEPVTNIYTLLTDQPDDPPIISPDSAFTVHTFEPLADAAPGDADPILNDAQGRCVVVTRTLGVGAVTMVGLPGWATQITNRGMPEADVFWHRVLGRRGLVANTDEMADLKQRNLIAQRGRPNRTVDTGISGLISKSGRSLIAVMLGLVVFIVYWLVAGPGGFGVLKTKGLARHSWVAFLSAALAFTAFAWGGATILRPKEVEIAHLTYLDHVYGQRVQRVRAWASVLTPVYGQATVALESDDAAAMGARFQQAVAPWEPAQSPGRGSFPDARDYVIDCRAPDTMTFPARSTVKQVQFDWAGGLDWNSIRPVTDGQTDPLSAIRFTNATGATHALDGALVHGLPGPLTDVKVVLFRGQKPVRLGLLKNQVLSRGNAWAGTSALTEWAPGQTLDLSAVTTLTASAFETTLDNLGTKAVTQGVVSFDDDARDWLAFFNLFGPPRADRRGFMGSPPVVRRESSHALDLSRWSTRPCLVVIGTLRVSGDADTLPMPVRVETNGVDRTEDARVSGITVVRWVYPLPPAPPTTDVLEIESDVANNDT